MQDPRHDATATAPREYASRLTSELAGLLDDRLTAAYLHGSAALGGWVADRSDVDILVVVARHLPDPALTATGELLMRWAKACPGRRGLECSVVTAGQAARPAPPWPFILHVAVRRGGPVLVRGDATAGDDDLLMHYEASRAAGITLAGAPPAAVIGAVDRLVILNYLASELDWGLANGPECYAVLNACRALVYLAEARIVSKVTGGLAALSRGTAPPGLVRRALDQQRAQAPERAPGPEAVRFVRRTAAALRAGAEAATPSPPA
jgi:Domain of unknown function (DUF4111)/Nucleotidyltransferase domain